MTEPQTSNKTLYLPKHMLMMYGCKTCAAKSFGLCYHGFTEPDEKVEEGICEELLNHLLLLQGPGDSISAVKEKFHLEIQEMQTLADHYDIHSTIAEIKKRKAEGASKEELGALEMKMHAYRLWWGSGTDRVTKGLSKVREGEQRKEQTLEVHHKLDLTQVHKLTNAVKLLEEKEDGM